MSHLDEPSASTESTQSRILIALSALLGCAVFGLILKKGIALGAVNSSEANYLDWARRIAAQQLHLAMPGIAPDPIFASDLGSAPGAAYLGAIGFKLFGVHDWAARLPLLVIFAIGVGWLGAILGAKLGKKEGLLFLILLFGMPGTVSSLRGDLAVATLLASLTLACASLLHFFVASKASQRFFLLGVVFATSSLLAWCSGAMWLGIIALAIWLCCAQLRPLRTLQGFLLGGVLTTASLVLIGFRLWKHPSSRGWDTYIFGSAIIERPIETTHELLLGQLAHGLFPIAALLPMILFVYFSRTLLTQSEKNIGEKPLNETLRTVQVFSVTVLFLVSLYYAVAQQGLSLNPWAGHVPLALLMAVILPATFRLPDWALRAISLGGASLLILWSKDFETLTSSWTTALMSAGSLVDESLLANLSKPVKIGGNLLALLWLSLWFERSMDQSTARRDALLWLSYFSAKRKIGYWLVAGTTLLLGLGGVLIVLVRHSILKLPTLHKALVRIPSDQLQLLTWVWVVPVVILTAPLGIVLWRELLRIGFRSRNGLRYGLPIIGICAFAFYQSYSYVALAESRSPKQIVTLFEELASPDSKLGILGVKSDALKFYSTRESQEFSQASKLAGWLVEDPSRFGLTTVNELPSLNATYRKDTAVGEGKARNLPVHCDLRSDILLVGGLASKDKGSPLDMIINSDAPNVQHPLEAKLGRELELVGWSMLDEDGAPLSVWEQKKPIKIAITWKLLRNLSSSWRVFLHIDGPGYRINADHDFLSGLYPVRNVVVGEYLTDTATVFPEGQLRAGEVSVHFGFYRGDERMSLKTGPGKDDRVNGGKIVVR